jgi:hypothetical protein
MALSPERWLRPNPPQKVPALMRALILHPEDGGGPSWLSSPAISWEGLLQTAARKDSGDAAGEPGRIGANLGADFFHFIEEKTGLRL